MRRLGRHPLKPLENMRVVRDLEWDLIEPTRLVLAELKYRRLHSEGTLPVTELPSGLRICVGGFLVCGVFWVL